MSLSLSSLSCGLVDFFKSRSTSEHYARSDFGSRAKSNLEQCFFLEMVVQGRVVEEDNPDNGLTPSAPVPATPLAVATAVPIAAAAPVQATMVQGTVVNDRPAQVMTTGFYDFPMQHTCQWCGYTGMTKVQSEICVGTHLMAGGICCVLGLWCGCCLIPYAVDAFKEKRHFCSSCHKLVGRKIFIA